MTQLFIKKNTQNIINNPTFRFINRNNWTTISEDSCGNYFDITSNNQLRYDKDSDACASTYSVIQETTYLAPNTRYQVSFRIDDIYRENSAGDSLSIQVYVGGVASASYVTAGTHSFEIIAGETNEIKIVASSSDYRVWFIVSSIQIYNIEGVYEFDLYKEIPIQVTYQTSDVREFASRKGAYTQTIQLPATNNNNQIFGNIGLIEVDSKFLVTKKTEIVLYEEGLIIFEGNLQLMNVKRSGDDIIEYEIKISSNVKDIRDDWSDDTFAVLDMKELNHYYTRYYIEQTMELQCMIDGAPTDYYELGTTKYFDDTYYVSSSGSTNGLLGLVFGSAHGLEQWTTLRVLLDNSTYNPQYEQWWTIVDVPDSTHIVLNVPFGTSTVAESGDVTPINSNGLGYTYGRIQRGDGGALSYEVENWKPNTNVKYLLKKMFNQYGYDFNSETLDTPYFKNLYIEHNQKKLVIADAIVNSTLFQAGQVGIFSDDYDGAGQTSPSDYAVILNDTSTPPNFDNFPSFDIANYRWDVPVTGFYEVTASVNVLASGFPVDPITGLFYGTFTSPTETILYVMKVQMIKINGATVTILDELQYISPVLNPSNTFGYSVPYEFYNDTVNLNFTGVLVDNDVIALRIEYDFWKTYDPITQTGVRSVTSGTNSLLLFRPTPIIPGHDDWYAVLNMTSSGAIMYNNMSNELYEGSLLNYNQVLPSDIKLIDFFDSICKKFNLQYQLEDTKTYRIETYETWYGQGEVKDWSDKIDVSNITITPTAALQPQKIVFKDTPGSDFWNQQTTANIVKDKDGNERQYGQYEIQTDNQWNKDTKEISTIFTPTIITNRKGDTSNRGYYEDYEVLPRIITELDKVEIPDEGIRLLYLNKNYTKNIWSIFSKTAIINPTEYYNTYVSLSHLDNAVVPTVDLNWSAPAITWFEISRYTDNNIYNKFYYSYIQDLLDINSKLITFKAYLTPLDIANIDMRDSIWIANNRYRINKITYTTAGSLMADVELITY